MAFGWDDAIMLGLQYLGGQQGSGAAKDAAKAQERALQAQLGLYGDVYNSQVAMNEPWRATGQGALNNLARLYGLPYYDYAPPQGINPGGGQITQKVGGRSLWNTMTGGVLGSEGRKATWGGSGEQLLTAGQVKRYLNQGMSVEDIAKLGRLETSLNPKRTRMLTNRGLSASDILALQQGNQQGVADMLGNYNPGGAPDMSVFTASPDYQFRRDEGMRGIEQSAAARGGALSGNALRSLNQFNSNMASTEFGNFFERQARLAGLGGAATNNNNVAAGAYGQNAGAALAGIGASRASGITGSANAWGNAFTGMGRIIGNAGGFGGAPQDELGYITPTSTYKYPTFRMPSIYGG